MHLEITQNYKINIKSANQSQARDLEFHFIDQNIICGDIPHVPKENL